MAIKIVETDEEPDLEYEFELRRKSKKTLNSGNQMINENDRLHPQVRRQLASYLRNLAYETIRKTNPPFSKEDPFLKKGEKCFINITVYPPTRRVFDPPNIGPTSKPLIDGMTDAGLWADDDKFTVPHTIFSYGGLNSPEGLNVDKEYYRVKISIWRWEGTIG